MYEYSNKLEEIVKFLSLNNIRPVLSCINSGIGESKAKNPRF